MSRLRFLVVQVVVVALLLELALRVYNPLPFRVDGERIVLPVRQVYRFDNRGTKKLDPVTTHSKNSLGFRGPDPPPDFDRRLTLLAIGGSTTESLFLSDGKTWPDQLSRRLSGSFPDIWVNNAGLDGQSTYGHLVLLQNVVIQLRPKIALFLVGINDVGLDRETTYDSALAPSPSLPRRLSAAILDHSAVARLAQNLYRVAATRRRGFGHSEFDPAAARHLVLDADAIDRTLAAHETYLERYRQRLTRLVELCRANQIEPVLITQPALFGDVVDPASGLDLSTVWVNGRGNGTAEWRLLERYNDLTRQAAGRGGLVIDLAREMPKDSRLFYDFLHFTNAGSVVVGDIVYRHLCPYLSNRFDRPAICDAKSSLHIGVAGKSQG